MKLFIYLIITLSFTFGQKYESSQVSPCSHTHSKFRHWNVVLQRQSLKNGFHRELTISIRIENATSATLFKNCVFLIKEEFPQGAFVDPYQIHLKPNDTYKIYVPEVNLEGIAQNSDPQLVYIFVNASAIIAPNNNYSITLPFHLRYQKAAYSDEWGNFADVYFGNPTVLSRCEKLDLSNACGYAISTEFCGPDDLQDCQWIKHREMDVRFDFLHFEVPRGNLDALPFVVTITSATILLGTFYLTTSIFRPVKSRLKYS